MFVLMESWYSGMVDVHFLRGVSATLEGAIALAAQHKLAGAGINDPIPDVEFAEDNWKIEEIPLDIMLRNDTEANDYYTVAGAIASYTIDGTLIRRLDDPVLHNHLD